MQNDICLPVKQKQIIDNKIYIQHQQRNARKGWTNILGLNISNDEMKLLSKTMSKKFACNSSIKKDAKDAKDANDTNAETISYIQLQGDHKHGVKILLSELFEIDPKNIIFKGY